MCAECARMCVNKEAKSEVGVLVSVCPCDECECLYKLEAFQGVGVH